MFPAPLNKEKIDHLFDNAARSKVLIEALMDYISNVIIFEPLLNNQRVIFYIIHPVLKHIAITRNNYENKYIEIIITKILGGTMEKYSS